jgi:hypothetical protein
VAASAGGPEQVQSAPLQQGSEEGGRSRAGPISGRGLTGVLGATRRGSAQSLEATVRGEMESPAGACATASVPAPSPSNTASSFSEHLARREVMAANIGRFDARGKRRRSGLDSRLTFPGGPMPRPLSAALCAAAMLISAAIGAADDDWKPLFNGRDLTGWTIKIAKRPLGENYLDTFRAEDGILKVGYDKWDKFDRHFGHIYTNQAYSNYLLRLEYRITGTAPEDAPHWAKLNSGVMVHSQSPLSLALDQEFPASMEFQFLSAGATAGKQTGNVCTPGTNLVMNGKLVEDHIIDSRSKLYPVDEWVQVEVEVRGNRHVIHRVNGVEVLRYENPQLDPKDESAQRLLAAGAPLQLSFGHIALQAESQPIWFRNIRIKQLEP